jgi:glycosyltransferase involved in cell wall biosynthesis
MNELISCIMPVYNVENYVAEAVESILNQNYVSFEFIIVDDCSSDGTYDVCRKYAEQDNRIKLYRNSQNLKIEKTLNFALTKATGNYIVRMDGDDISAPDRFKVMKDYLDGHKDIALIGTSVNTIYADGTKVGQSCFLSNQKLIQRTLLLQTPVVHIWMTYKWLYNELKGYRIFSGSEDYDFVLRTITAGYKVSNISDYYGYTIRINRPCNTAVLYGLKRVRSLNYVKKMYKERIKYGFDSYSCNNLNKYIKTSVIEEFIFKQSNSWLYKGIQARSQKRWFRVFLCTFLSLISPYQVKYLINRFKYFKLTKNSAK